MEQIQRCSTGSKKTHNKRCISSSSNARILINGAGLAGLTCAQALKKQGFKVTVVDANDENHNESQGYLLHPNATEVIHKLGLGKQLEEKGHLIRYYSVANPQTGRKIVDPIYLYEKAAKYESTNAIGISKPDLIKVLQTGLIVRRKSEIASLKQEVIDGKKIVQVQLRTSLKHEPYDLVIGADGMNSETRRMIFPESKIKKEGARRVYDTWQAILPRGPNIEDNISFELWGEGHRLFGTPCGKNKIFVWATSEYVPMSSMLKDGLLSIGGYVGSTTAEFEKWKGHGVEDIVSELRRMNSTQALAQKSKIYRTVPYQLDLESWYKDRVVLIGDAAHPSFPNLNQGGAMAIEDGFVLAQHVSNPNLDLDSALNRYFTERSPRVTKYKKYTNWFNLKGEKRYIPWARFEVALSRKFMNYRVARHHSGIPEYRRSSFFYNYHPWKEFPKHNGA